MEGHKVIYPKVVGKGLWHGRYNFRHVFNEQKGKEEVKERAKL
jgi:hypothetical protein